MPKFTQIPANPSPSVNDYIIGHTVAGVDDKMTVAQLAALVSANLGSKVLIDLGYIATNQGNAVLPPAWTTYATIVATSRGGAIRARFNASYLDGSSGAQRNGDMRVVCDGVVVPNSTIRWNTPGSGLATTAMTIAGHTPSAGSHTWTFQILANTGSASLIGYTQAEVQEASP